MKDTKFLPPQPEPPHDTSVNVRMTLAQKKQITEMAQKFGVSASELMRHFTFQALDHLSDDASNLSEKNHT